LEFSEESTKDLVVLDLLPYFQPISYFFTIMLLFLGHWLISLQDFKILCLGHQLVLYQDVLAKIILLLKNIFI